MTVHTLPTSRLIELAESTERRRNEYLKNEDLVEGHDRLLLELMLNDGIPMGILADNLNISASSTTKMAVKLEAKSLIRREASRIDSRQNHAWLTETGQEMAGRIAAAYTAIDEEIMQGLKRKETERLRRIIEKLEAGLNGKKPPSAKKPRKPGKPNKKKKKEKAKG